MPITLDSSFIEHRLRYHRDFVAENIQKAKSYKRGLVPSKGQDVKVKQTRGAATGGRAQSQKSGTKTSATENVNEIQRQQDMQAGASQTDANLSLMCLEKREVNAGAQKGEQLNAEDSDLVKMGDHIFVTDPDTGLVRVFAITEPNQLQRLDVVDSVQNLDYQNPGSFEVIDDDPFSCAESKSAVTVYQHPMFVDADQVPISNAPDTVENNDSFIELYRNPNFHNQPSEYGEEAHLQVEDEPMTMDEIIMSKRLRYAPYAVHSRTGVLDVRAHANPPHHEEAPLSESSMVDLMMNLNSRSLAATKDSRAHECKNDGGDVNVELSLAELVENSRRPRPSARRVSYFKPKPRSEPTEENEARFEANGEDEAQLELKEEDDEMPSQDDEMRLGAKIHGNRYPKYFH